MVLHVPNGKRYEVWAGLSRSSREYKELKEERSRVLWKAIALALEVDDPQELVDVQMVGTPLTHERFLRRKVRTKKKRKRGFDPTHTDSITGRPIACCASASDAMPC